MGEAYHAGERGGGVKAKLIHAITERTDREWAPDHGLRQVSIVLPDAELDRAEFLICSYVGGERLPPADGDSDVVRACSACDISVVARASAPAHLKPLCQRCWTRL